MMGWSCKIKHKVLNEFLFLVAKIYQLFLVDFYPCCSCLLKWARTGSTFFRRWGLQLKRRWAKDLGLPVSWDCFCLRRERCFASVFLIFPFPKFSWQLTRRLTCAFPAPFTWVTAFRSGHLLITKTSREGNLVNTRREKMISILSTMYPLIIPTSSICKKKKFVTFQETPASPPFHF